MRIEWLKRSQLVFVGSNFPESKSVSFGFVVKRERAGWSAFYKNYARLFLVHHTSAFRTIWTKVRCGSVTRYQIYKFIDYPWEFNEKLRVPFDAPRASRHQNFINRNVIILRNNMYIGLYILIRWTWCNVIQRNIRIH